MFLVCYTNLNFELFISFMQYFQSNPNSLLLELDFQLRRMIKLSEETTKNLTKNVLKIEILKLVLPLIGKKNQSNRKT